MTALRHWPAGTTTPMTLFAGDSANSLLIHYVARQVKDMEMPPVGKGNPLTPEQISLLRAWIDQGANWSTTNQTAHLAFTFAPTLRWIGVQGDKAKFRELSGCERRIFRRGGRVFVLPTNQSHGKILAERDMSLPPTGTIKLNLAVDEADQWIHPRWF